MDQSDDHGRIPFEVRHPKIQEMLSSAHVRWVHMQRVGFVRFLGTFAILFAHRRAFGFAAEAAFWGTFTLPWLILGGVSAVSNVAAAAGQNMDGDIEETILDAVRNVLTPEAVDSYVKPMLDEVVTGSAGLGVIGLIAAMWSGSRVFATFVEGSALINGSPKRNYLETRGLALTIYVLGLLTLAIVVFSVVKWPDLWQAALGILPGGVAFWIIITALGLAAAATTTMMWLANPRRTKWRYALPGGGVGLIIWLAGSWGLQTYMSWLLRDGSIYGAIASPIAVMLWVFVTTLAMFIGITLNAAILLFMDVRNRNLASLDHRAESALIAGNRLIQMADHPDGAANDPSADSAPIHQEDRDSIGESEPPEANDGPVHPAEPQVPRPSRD